MSFNNEGLLNDNEINELCTIPQSVVDWVAYRNIINTEPMISPLGDLDASAKKYHDDAKLRATRPTTQAERDAFEPMIEPFLAEQVKRKTFIDVDGEQREAKLLSFGLSSFGYDVTLAKEFWIFVPSYKNFLMRLLRRPNVVDPKRPDPKNLKKLKVHIDDDGCKYVIMPPNSYGMGYTVEYFKMPRDVNAVCVGKSTYARSTIEVNVTPIEAGFHGQVVIELANGSHCPARVYLEEGIAQFQFQRARPCSTSYADRQGKYQGQTGLTVSRV